MAESQLLVIGFSGDHTTQHVLRHLVGHEHDFLELFEFYETGTVDLELGSDRLVVRGNGNSWNLADYRCIYQRLLPPGQSDKFASASRIHQARFRALDLAIASSPARVVNALYAGWENNFKPLQTYLLAEAGFRVPASMSTSIVQDYEAFTQPRSAIYKSNSGERSIVEVVSASTERAGSLHECPVFFQELIPGLDVRVHSVGERSFGVAIESDVTDYRYAQRHGSAARFRPYPDIPDEVSRLCVEYAKSRGVYIAGFDFKLTPDGGWYCLEMNPSPGFDVYDRILGGEIGTALVHSLLRP